MKGYYVVKQPTEEGSHEIHVSTCFSMPSKFKRIYLGEFAERQEAFAAARKFYAKVIGCKDCSSENHTE